MDNVVIDISTTVNAPVITVDNVVYNVDVNIDTTNINADVDVSTTEINNVIEVDTEVREVTIEAKRGDKGDKGDQGIQGIQGIQGVKGDQGVQGDEGIQGIQGIQGDEGIQGIQGIQGDEGVQGVQGIKGDQGDQGIQGIQGTQGVQGIQGNQGIQGEQGVPGTDGTDLTRGAYRTKSTSYQLLATDDSIAITTSGNTMTLQTVGMQDSQEVTIFNYSSGDNSIVGLIDSTTPTTIGADDAFGLKWNGSSYDLMFKKKDESVVGGRTATYYEDFFTESSINISNYFESKLANASDLFKQDLKLQHDGFAEDGLVGFVIDPNYSEEFIGNEIKTSLVLIDLGDTDNAEVKDVSPNSNFSGQTSIIVRDEDALGNGATFGLFQWDLTGLSDYTPTSVGSFNFNVSSNGGGLLARSIILTVSTQATSFFDENTVTFNNQPSNGTIVTTQTTSIPANSTNLDVSVSLTQSEIDSCIGSFVFIQVVRVNEITDGSVEITSKEGLTFPRLSFNAEINY